LSHLLRHGVCDFASTVTDVDVEQARETVDVALPVRELDPDPLTARDDAGPLDLVFAKLGNRVDEMCAIEVGKGFEISLRHGSSPSVVLQPTFSYPRPAACSGRAP